MLTIITSIIVLLAAAVAFGFHRSAPLRDITLTNEVTIQAPMDEVFPLVQYLGNFPRWSPFLEQDPAQKYEVRGKDGTVGATFHWDGRGGKDLGHQTIVSVDPGRSVKMTCDIQKPFQAYPSFAYAFANTPDGIRVTQTFNVESKPIDALFMWLFGAKAEMDAVNERGLELLRQAAEDSPVLVEIAR